MADYYPLLSRAVSGLANSGEEARQAIYGRARKALLGQLQAIQPPVPQADIDREAQALDQAIARIEAELAVAAALGGDDFAAPPQPAAPPPQPAAPVVSAPPRLPSAPVVTPPGTAPSVASPPVSNPPPLPPGAPGSSPPVPPPLRPPAPAPRPGAPPAAPSVSAAPMAQPPSPSLPRATTSDAAAREPAPASASEPESGRPGEAAVSRRPSAPAKSATRDRSGLYALLTALAVGLAAIIGYFAWQWRLTPVELSQPRPAPGVSQPQTPAATAQPEQPEQRIVQRVPSGDAPAANPPASEPASQPAGQPSSQAASEPETPPAGQPAQQEPAQQPAQTPPAQQAQAPQTQAPAAEVSPGVPVAQRAAILIAAPTTENPNGVDTRIGTVVWRTDNVNRGASQPVSLAIRGDVDIPSAGLKVILTIEKNLDTTLPASHMITVRFQREANSVVGEIADIETLQMRDQQSPQVEPLDAARAKITANIFIIALTQSETITKRNVDSMLARGWLDLPMRLADGKLSKLTMEKGGPGDKIFKDVFARWEK